MNELTISTNIIDRTSEGSGIDPEAPDCLHLTGHRDTAVVFQKGRIFDTADVMRCNISEFVNGIKKEPCFNPNITSRRMPDILQIVASGSKYASADWKNLYLFDGKLINEQPCSLSYLHLAQLSLHRFGLVA